ncbi:protein of unknown function [Chryseobacterium sp. JV274]|nr:protein of unknown function [Chryseobacterium sp. JV274]
MWSKLFQSFYVDYLSDFGHTSAGHDNTAKNSAFTLDIQGARIC